MDPQSGIQNDDASHRLAAIEREIAGCTKCPLAQTRTNTVPGEGSPTAEIMFVGEGPGADEDRTGRPFVGRAGKLLDELIESLPMRREDVFIANVVKCRPPENRDPTREEIEMCSNYLREQIETVDPLVVVPLGRHALGWFVSNPRITADHGKIMRYEDRALMPLLHPSAGLRNPENAKRLRESIHNVRDAILEGIRIKQEVAERSVEAEPTATETPKPESEEPMTIAPVEHAETTTREPSGSTPGDGNGNGAVGLLERPQTADEVQDEMRRLRAIEEAEEAAANEPEKIDVDDRQSAFF